jgi:hypothetical protein
MDGNEKGDIIGLRPTRIGKLNRVIIQNISFTTFNNK